MIVIDVTVIRRMWEGNYEFVFVLSLFEQFNLRLVSHITLASVYIRLTNQIENKDVLFN